MRLEEKQMAEFTVDIRGRINNTNLPDSKYLWALLESIRFPRKLDPGFEVDNTAYQRKS